MEMAKFSLTLGCPMNSASRCGRSFSSNDESSSTGAADTSRCFRSGMFLAVATKWMVRRKGKLGNHVEDCDRLCGDGSEPALSEVEETRPVERSSTLVFDWHRNKSRRASLDRAGGTPAPARLVVILALWPALSHQLAC